MAIFVYEKDKTTIDDIIEHILMRLNTDFTGGSLQVPDFCRNASRHEYDYNMEMKVRDKMYKHGIAKRSDGTGQPDTAIVLTAKGADVYENGGWRKYLANYEIQIKIQQEKANRQSNNITINAPVTGSQIGYDSEFGDLRLDIASKNDIRQIPIEIPKPKSNQDIWDKLKSVAQILGFGTALIALITKLFDLW